MVRLQVLDDMVGPAPMLRLLQGDVGSGKTVVAFLAATAAAGSGWQAAMMAPTEVRLVLMPLPRPGGGLHLCSSTWVHKRQMHLAREHVGSRQRLLVYATAICCAYTVSATVSGKTSSFTACTLLPRIITLAG